ncbi:hypothetical protein ACQEU3_39265 [Spirillospora sp. CA-253888]
MGASGWEYFVPYQEDLQQALQELRDQVFQAREYLWDPWVPEEQRRPWPATIEALWADEVVQHNGTHSILDMFQVLDADAVVPDQESAFAVQVVGPEEAFRHLGARKITRAHVPEFEVFRGWRWFGRCAVLHDDRGVPTEICFWGFSGD